MKNIPIFVFALHKYLLNSLISLLKFLILSNAKIDSMMKNGTPEENKKLYEKFENVKIDRQKKKSCCLIF